MFTEKEAKRIFSHIDIDPITKCWNWTRKLDNGYGRISFKGKNWKVYKLLYIWKNGEIPKWRSFADLELDHICNNRACVNPEHLKLISHKENTLKGNGVTAINARKILCKYGHPLSPDNRGHRKCKECMRIYEKSRNRKHIKSSPLST